MRNFQIVVLSILLLSISSCSLLNKNKGRIDTNKDIKTEKKQIEFQYAFFEANKQKMLGNLNDAGAYYLRCIELNPESAAANYEFAGILAIAQDYSHAIKYAKKAYEIDPENMWYQALLVTVYKSTGDLKKSSALLEDMLIKHPDDYNSYLELTDTYLKMDQAKDALATLDKFEKKYGFSEALMIEKNRIHIRRGNFSDARLEVQKMIKIEPENSTHYLLLANLYLEEGQIDRAYEIYQDILKLDPDNGRVHFSLSDYYQQKGDEKKAFEELEKAISSDAVELDLKVKLIFSYVGIKDPTNNEKKQVYKLIKILLDKYPQEMKVRTLYSDILVKDKQYEEARKELLIITENTPDNYLVWEQLLFVDNQLADFTSLYKNSVKMIEYFPNKAIAYFFAGLSSYQINKYKESVDYIESGVDFSMNDTILQAQFYTILGDAYHRLKNNEKSDEAYENAIRLNPSNYYVHNNYSYYLSLRKEKLKRAKELMNSCIKEHPKNGTYLDTYAWVLFMDKDYKKALEIIEKAYTHGGNKSAVIVEHYGDILFKNGNATEAVNKWKEAKELGEGSSFLEQKIIEKKLIEE